MTTEYHKIDNVYSRDRRGRLVEGVYARPELAYLADLEWLWTEKVNGTNVRLSYDASATFRGNEHAYVAGRTDAAQLPPPLLRRCVELLRAAPLEDVFEVGPTDVVLYGEGYGAGIQSGGGDYRADGVDFVLFDVKVGDWWLRRADVEDVAAKLGLDVVPLVGRGTLAEAVELTRTGFPSARWPGVAVAEGLVLRPAVELFDRAGRRVVAKIKHRDLRRPTA
jgi:hypothetical protein